MDWLIQAGQYAGAISAVIGLAVLLLYKPVIKPRLDAAKAEKAEQARQMQQMSNALSAVQKELSELKKAIEQLNQDTSKRFDRVYDDIGDLQYERLSQAHDFYMDRGWCPSSKKMQLCHMHDSYKDKGRNHLSDHFQQDLLNLPDNPSNEHY